MSTKKRNETRPSGNIHGVFVLDKPSGITSHGVVSAVRRAFGTRKVGHAGTLDPMATGVLVMLLGEATKLSSILTTEKKAYLATVRFGETTDTLDADGKIDKRVELADDWLDRKTLENALMGERSRRLQIPPQVSAIKVDGQRAYARARRGETTALAPRDVTVHELEVEEIEDKEIKLRVVVSKGYYIRSLAHDLGEALGVGAHLSALKRIQSGHFSIDQAEAWPPNSASPLLPIGEVVRQVLPCYELTPLGALRLSQGKRLALEHFEKPEELARLAGTRNESILAAFHAKRLIALIEAAEMGEFRVKRGINDPIEAPEPLPLAPLTT